MTEGKNNKRFRIFVKDIENENLKEKFKNILPLIKEISDKKVNDFQKSVKKFKNDENYEFKHILIERHFLFKTIQEIDEKLTKNKEVFLIDLGDLVRNFFDDQTLFYWEEKGYFDFDTNTLNINLANEDLYYLDLVIKEHTKDKELISHLKKLETNSPVLYVSA